eukprot:Gb_11972 [translate_table: standard]
MHMTGTMKSSTMLNTVRKHCKGNHNQISAEREMEKSMIETPVNSTLTSSNLDKVHNEAWFTQVPTMVDNDGLLPKLKKYRARRQKGKGKVLKKRLLSDLIATTPFEQIRSKEVSWSHRVKHMSRRTKFGIQRRNLIRKWRVSKAAAYNLRKFKEKLNYLSEVSYKPQSESIEVKRKQQPGVSHQSSTSSKAMVEETRGILKRQFDSNMFARPQNEIPSSRDLEKEVPFEGFVQHETETHLDQDDDDDVLIDLAGFMAQNQFERHATSPSYSCLQDTECFTSLGLRKKEAQDLNHVVTRKSEQRSDLVQLDKSYSSKEDSGKDQDAFTCIPTEYAPENNKVHLVVENDHLQVKQMQVSPMPEKVEMLGQIKEAGVISETRNAKFSSPNHISDKNTLTVESNLNKDANAPSVGHKANLVNAVTMEGQKSQGHSTIQKKKSAIEKSLTQLKELVKSSCIQLSLIEKTNNALNAALFSVASTPIPGYNPDGSVPTISCKDTVLDTAQTVTGAMLGPAQTFAATSFAPAQRVVRPISAASDSQIRPINSKVLLDDANSERSNTKVNQLNQIDGCSKLGREDMAFTMGYKAQVGMLHAATIERDFPMNPMTRLLSRSLVLESSLQNLEQANDRVRQTHGTCLAHPTVTTLPGPCCSVLLPASMTSIPVKNYPVENRSKHVLNSSGPHRSLDCALPYFASSVPSSLLVKPIPEDAMCKDHSQRSSAIFSFSQGNRLDTQTVLSQESFNQGKFDLQAYIQRRIQIHLPSQHSKRSATTEAEKDTQKRPKFGFNPCGNLKPDIKLSGQVLTQEKEEIQMASSQDSEVCTLNQNPAEVMDLGNGVLTKKRVVRCQKVVGLPMNADEQNCKEKRAIKVRQFQADGQTDVLAENMDTTLENADGQNCKKKTGMNAQQFQAESEIDAIRENMDASLENAPGQICKEKKGVMGKQIQVDSQSFVCRENMDTTLENAGQNCKRKEGIKAKQGQADSQTLSPKENLDHNLVNADGQNSRKKRSMKAKSVQARCHTFVLRQKMGIASKYADEQNCEKKKGARTKWVQAGSQTLLPVIPVLSPTDASAKNMDCTLKIADEKNNRRKKGIKSKQVQVDSHMFALSQADPPEENTDNTLWKTLKSDKLMESSVLNSNLPTDVPVVKRRKYVKKAEKEAIEAQKKLEAQSHSKDIDMRAIENYIMQGNVCRTPVAPVKHGARVKRVLKPIAQNAKQCLLIPSSIDHLEKEAIEAKNQIKLCRVKPMEVKKKLKSQSSSIQNFFDPSAIERYIKQGKFWVTPSSQALPPKVAEPANPSAGSINSSLDQSGKSGNPFDKPHSSGHSIMNATEMNLFGAKSGTSTMAFPARTGSKPDNIMSFQDSMTAEIQVYLEKSKINFSSFIPTGMEVSVSKDLPEIPI